MKPDGVLNEEMLRSKFGANEGQLNKAIDACKTQGKTFNHIEVLKKKI